MSATRLLSALRSRIGRDQANLEYKWMTQAASHELDLVAMIRRRLVGEPLQFILGSQPFGPLNLLTRPPVLIPRPETEHWVTRLSQFISPVAHKPLRLLDLGTGTGCIPLLLCHLWPPGAVKATGIDVSDAAIQLAIENAALCGIAASHDDNCNKNTFLAIKANILDPCLYKNPAIQRPIDALTSNPPYISWKEYFHLPHSVSGYEDPKALFGGPFGMDFYHAIADFITCDGTLSPGAVVALEVGDGQANKVQRILTNTGRIKHTEIWNDPWGKERTVIGLA
ncbi:hypothetical protein M378DRAFT_161595 [Amanita muscaria Koide BX008]|uniref:S-adenosyl-L-methionine-dependent methyltransferase n=1 Tax=Amanita muscaria (strain Koide BX008) TaxID=946122 RepID=A0A0C2SRK9_AMAMK|nr:hypothetical protein M378DRAFT_161595 [Amanita muscaria Koide BX008]